MKGRLQSFKAAEFFVGALLKVAYVITATEKAYALTVIGSVPVLAVVTGLNGVGGAALLPREVFISTRSIQQGSSTHCLDCHQSKRAGKYRKPPITRPTQMKMEPKTAMNPPPMLLAVPSSPNVFEKPSELWLRASERCKVGLRPCGFSAPR